MVLTEPPDSPDPEPVQAGPGPSGRPSMERPSLDRGAAAAPSAGIPGPPAWCDLVVRTEHATHRLRGGVTYRLGRDPASDIVITDPRVSWEHALLRVDEDAWVLEDRSSTNGTYVGTQRVDRVRIAGDCNVRLGHQDTGPVLRCRPDEAEAATVGTAVRRVATTSGPSTEPLGVPAGASGTSARLPGVDRNPRVLTRLPADVVRIGRAPDSDVVLPDLEVSRRHAELRRLPTGSVEIVDLASHNGTYVNGARISSQPLTEHDIVGIGHSTFRLKDGELRQFVDEGEITFAAQDLVVRLAGGKVLLDGVTFPIPEKCLVGVIGPSGAGKSTLLGALTGMRPATTGTVLYDHRELYRHYAELRHRIGLVPQDNILHTQLTARRALQYSAELRFPTDTKPAERDTRISEVMEELGLSRHADTRADRLSGGQLKRVNVAQELLTKPSLLFLDEPTSGLDAGLDKSVMEQMRDLAHDGRTIIVVTHSVANLDTCDRLLVLVPGGKVAFYGPPAEGLRFFGLPGWAEVFQAFDRFPNRDWGGEFAASPFYVEYVARHSRTAPVDAGNRPLPPAPPPPRRGWFRQLGTLTRRYVRVIASDRGYLLFMGMLPIVLGLLIHFVPAKEGLAGRPHTNLTGPELLSILVICACLAGTACSVRELVKERPIYVRERAAGLSSGAYLLSKLVVLGALSIVQSVVIVLLGVAGRKLPDHGALLTRLPLLELLIAVALLALASMCLGLLVSALVSTSEKAMPFLVMLTMGQIILSGGPLPLAGLSGLSQLSWLAPARWGFAATASTVNLNLITPVTGTTDPLWRHTSGSWLRDIGCTVGLGLVFGLLTWVRLRRLGPRRQE